MSHRAAPVAIGEPLHYSAFCPQQRAFSMKVNDNGKGNIKNSDYLFFIVSVPIRCKVFNLLQWNFGYNSFRAFFAHQDAAARCPTRFSTREDERTSW